MFKTRRYVADSGNHPTLPTRASTYAEMAPSLFILAALVFFTTEACLLLACYLGAAEAAILSYEPLYDSSELRKLSAFLDAARLLCTRGGHICSGSGRGGG
jgi:hypothetical protein